MNRKIELLLQVAADFQDFCTPNTPFDAVPYSSEELTESDLDMVAAAVKAPAYTDISLGDKE